MSKINFEDLEDEYDSLPSRERTRTNVERVVGSLTDNLRMVKVNRNGAYKRAARAKEWGKNHGTL